MNSVYMNYASTSPVKPQRVVDAAAEYLAQNQFINAGRNFEGLDDSKSALAARMAVQKLFCAPSPTCVFFTSGVTLSLNMVLNGLIEPGDHVLATSIEHNAVARPLALLEERGVCRVSYLPCGPDGSLAPELIARHVKSNTRLLVMSHASNVLGTVLPMEECFAAAKEHGLYTVLDSAQTAGAYPLAMGPCTDVITFTGHKGLRALSGTGGFVCTKDAANAIRPWLVGGTGSASHQLAQPSFLPDKFEPGTANALGIISLAAAVEELLAVGVANVRRHEQALTHRFLSGAGQIPELCVYGTKNAAQSVAVVSVSILGKDSGVVARQLFDEYGILTRSGLHCSPLAHKTAGTYPEGTIRFSFGQNTTGGEIDYALEALEKVCAAN